MSSCIATSKLVHNGGYIQNMSSEILWFGRLYLVTKVSLNFDRSYSISAIIQYFEFRKSAIMDQYLTFCRDLYMVLKYFPAITGNRWWLNSGRRKGAAINYDRGVVEAYLQECEILFSSKFAGLWNYWETFGWGFTLIFSWKTMHMIVFYLNLNKIHRVMRNLNVSILV